MSLPPVTQQRRQQRLRFFDTTVRDLRHAVRSLGRNAGFSTVAIVSLALGIGATTSMFTVVNAVLLRPLPFADPGRLIEISEVNPLKGWTHTVVAPANLADWRSRNTVFTDIAAYNGVDDRGASDYRVFLSGTGETLPLNGLATTGNLFEVLGVRPLLGRTFTYDETFDGRDRVVVLAYGTWQGVFGGDPGIVGRSIVLSGRTTTVVGVMPREFFFPNRGVQFWKPLGVKPDIFVNVRRPHFLNTVARLQPYVSLAQARDQMTRIAGDLERAYPDTNTQMGVRLEPLHDIMAADSRLTVVMLFGAVGALFLIVCANVAGLQLGRGLGRAREIAIRRALGATRGRLVRQLLTEGLVLSMAGGALGLALGASLLPMLLRFAPDALPLFAAPRMDVPALMFAGALVLLAPAAFGLLPALASSHREQLSERHASQSRRTTTARDLLVACEVGLSVVLITGAALLVRSLIHLQQVDPGFMPERVLTFVVTLPNARYPKDADHVRVVGEIERRIRSVPGVEAVGATSKLALRGYTWTGDATVEGRDPSDYERELRHESVTPEYFHAMGIRLLAGRALDERDSEGANVTLVNDALATQYFRGADPVGRRIKFGRPQDNDPWTTIVGVVADGKQDGMDKPVKPEVYVSLAQSAQNPVTFAVRTAAALDPTLGRIREELRGVDKDLVPTDVAALADVVRDSMAGQRFRTTLLSGFAGAALLLASLGVYGVLAYFVSQRTRELGIRLALGATPVELFRLVVGQGMRPVVAGAAAGLAGAVGLTGLMQSFLFGVDAIDGPTYAGAMAVLALAACAACALPAVRAMRVDPLVVLRDE